MLPKQENASTPLKGLSIEVGDQIEVIDGRPENYWWKGQSQRTFEIGFFPRCISGTPKALTSSDISRPLRNSFIHAGHGGDGGETWGNPGFIDDMYLKNPLEPPDKLGYPKELPEIPKLADRNKSKNLSLN